MFFNISKIFIFLTDPLFFILLLAFLGGLKFKRKLIFLTIFIVFYLISIPFVSQRLMYFIEHIEAPTYSPQLKYDAVIVLSGMVNLQASGENRIEFSDAVDRILEGIALMKENKARYLVISGGSGSLVQDNRSEATLLDKFAQNLGIAEDKILLDTTSQNTYQNAVNSLKILTDEKLKRVVLITSAFHMFRSNGCFKKVGIKADLLPVDYNSSIEITDFRTFIPSTSALSQSNLFIHETIGIIVYGITGRATYF